MFFISSALIVADPEHSPVYQQLWRDLRQAGLHHWNDTWKMHKIYTQILWTFKPMRVVNTKHVLHYHFIIITNVYTLGSIYPNGRRSLTYLICVGNTQMTVIFPDRLLIILNMVIWCSKTFVLTYSNNDTQRQCHHEKRLQGFFVKLLLRSTDTKNAAFVDLNGVIFSIIKLDSLCNLGKWI